MYVHLHVFMSEKQNPCTYKHLLTENALNVRRYVCEDYRLIPFLSQTVQHYVSHLN